MNPVIDALKASKRKATHQRDNWKRRAEVYRVVLEEIAAGPCCGCCADDDPQCDAGRAKDALRAAPSRPAAGRNGKHEEQQDTEDGRGRA